MEAQQLLDLEKRFWKGDADVYVAGLADECIMVFAEPVGVLTRDAIVESIAGGQRWSDVAFRDARVLPLGDDAVLVTYAATGQREGAEPYTALVSSVYVQRQGEWKLAFHQHTPSGG